jgi:hypothetical protein
MPMNNENDTSRFTIQDEPGAVAESIYVADAENLRIEKLSTRITLVAVLIPCLLVIVLAVAYLDIKNRVVSTQNTGTIGVQNLSKDLESRFSSLSLKQAKLEERLDEATSALDTAAAGIQVNYKKAITKIGGDINSKANQSDLAAFGKKTDTAIAALKKEVSALNAAFTKFDDELADQILVIAQGLKNDQERLAAMENKAQQLEAEKLSKASMNLSLGLERLALQEMIKDKIRAVEKKLLHMEKRIDTLNKQISAQTKASSPPAKPVPSPSPSTPPASGSNQAPSPPAGIEEQTIN